MNKALLLFAFITLFFQQMLIAQTDLLQLQPRPFGELSLMVTPEDEELTYFMSASILFGGKKAGWQNKIDTRGPVSRY